MSHPERLRHQHCHRRHWQGMPAIGLEVSPLGNQGAGGRYWCGVTGAVAAGSAHRADGRGGVLARRGRRGLRRLDRRRRPRGQRLQMSLSGLLYDRRSSQRAASSSATVNSPRISAAPTPCSRSTRRRRRRPRRRRRRHRPPRRHRRRRAVVGSAAASANCGRISGKTRAASVGSLRRLTASSSALVRARGRAQRALVGQLAGGCRGRPPHRRRCRARASVASCQYVSRLAGSIVRSSGTADEHAQRRPRSATSTPRTQLGAGPSWPRRRPRWRTAACRRAQAPPPGPPGSARAGRAAVGRGRAPRRGGRERAVAPAAAAAAARRSRASRRRRRLDLSPPQPLNASSAPAACAPRRARPRSRAPRA